MQQLQPAKSAPRDSAARPVRAFYCVADRHYFSGVVALLNSLRLVGQREPLVVLDRGLERGQRAALEPVATVLHEPVNGHARLAKAAAPQALPASEVIAIVDSDVIAVRPLEALLELAASGRVVAFADDQPKRFHADWSRALGGAELHRHTYVNAGLLLLPGELAPAILATVTALFERVDFSRSRGFGRGSMSDPFRLPDQDCWNAALAATVPPSKLTVLDHQLAPFQPWERASVADARTLACRVPGGRRPHLLHHIGAKPWLAEAELPASAYSTLLPRLLHGEDIALRLAPPAPAVSVILPTYQRRAAVARAVRSVLAQRHRDFELIVVDDGSGDGTEEELAPLAPLLRYARQPHRGLAAARNAALRLARGRIIAFLDDDDRWLSDHLTVIVGLFDRHPGAVLACTAPANPRPRTTLGASELLDPFPEILTRAIAGTPSATAVRRDELEAVGGFDESLPDGCEDRDLWRRLALRGPFALARRRTVLIGRSESSLSRRTRRDGTALAGYERGIRNLRIRLEGTGEPLAAGQVAGLCRYLDALALLRAGELGDGHGRRELERTLAEAVRSLPGLSRDPALILDHIAQLEGSDEPQLRLAYLSALAAAWPQPRSRTALALKLEAVRAAVSARRPAVALELLCSIPPGPALGFGGIAAARRTAYGTGERIHDLLPVVRVAGATLAGAWQRAHPR